MMTGWWGRSRSRIQAARGFDSRAPRRPRLLLRENDGDVVVDERPRRARCPTKSRRARWFSTHTYTRTPSEIAEHSPQCDALQVSARFCALIPPGRKSKWREKQQGPKDALSRSREFLFQCPLLYLRPLKTSSLPSRPLLFSLPNSWPAGPSFFARRRRRRHLSFCLPRMNESLDQKHVIFTRLESPLLLSVSNPNQSILSFSLCTHTYTPKTTPRSINQPLLCLRGPVPVVRVEELMRPVS